MHSTQTISRVVAVALLIITGLFCLIAAEADAAPLTPELQADYAAGLQGWEVTSPPQCASVTGELLPTDPFTDEDGVHAAMRATQPRPEETGVECHFYVFEDAVARVEAAFGSAAPCVFAILARHEVGHLLGNGHSTDPASIMYPSPSTSACAPPATAVALPPDEPYVEAPWTPAERHRSWRIYRQLKRGCGHLRGPGQRKCYAEARSLASFIRDEAP